MPPDQRYQCGVLFRQTAPGSGLAREGIDLLLAMVAFEQSCSALFLGDAVSLLLPVHQAESPGLKLPQRALSALPAYGDCDLFVCGDDLAVLGQTAQRLILPVTLLESGTARRWWQSCQHVVAF